MPLFSFVFLAWCLSEGCVWIYYFLLIFMLLGLDRSKFRILHLSAPLWLSWKLIHLLSRFVYDIFMRNSMSLEIIWVIISICCFSVITTACNYPQAHFWRGIWNFSLNAWMICQWNSRRFVFSLSECSHVMIAHLHVLICVLSSSSNTITGTCHVSKPNSKHGSKREGNIFHLKWILLFMIFDRFVIMVFGFDFFFDFTCWLASTLLFNGFIICDWQVFVGFTVFCVLVILFPLLCFIGWRIWHERPQEMNLYLRRILQTLFSSHYPSLHVWIAFS